MRKREKKKKILHDFNYRAVAEMNHTIHTEYARETQKDTEEKYIN